MGIKIKQSGDFKNIETFFLKHRKFFTEEDIIDIAEYGLKVFSENTPSKSGKTSESWSYEITSTKNKWNIEYNNSNIQNGINIAILVDTGHGTSEGKWVSGTHYIDKSIKTIYKYIDKKNNFE